jgi:hypothetical protein
MVVMQFLTLILTFLLFYLVLSNKPSYDDVDEKKVRVRKSLDTLKDRSMDWLSTSVGALRALYDAVTSMAATMVAPKKSSFCGPCAAAMVA